MSWIETKAVGRMAGHSSRFVSHKLGPQTGFMIVLLAFVFFMAQNALAGTFREVKKFGSNPGKLGMYKYVPDTFKPNSPLVVVLHGGKQEAVAYARATGWPDMARRCGFALLLPEQKKDNNLTLHFNWFVLRDCWPGQNQPIALQEASSIIQMIDQMKADHPIDTSRVYVTGLSAGGAMTALLLAHYPERFAGGAIIAGLPYRCATNLDEALSCMVNGKELSRSEWGNRVRGASNHRGSWPRISIWHGLMDQRVTPINAMELMKQWTNVHGIDHVPDKAALVGSHVQLTYTDKPGRPLVELYLISNMEHGTPVDPGLGAEQGGALIPNVLDADIFSTLHIVKFWGLYNGEL